MRTIGCRYAALSVLTESVVTGLCLVAASFAPGCAAANPESLLFDHYTEVAGADVTNRGEFFVHVELGWFFLLGYPEPRDGEDTNRVVRGGGFSVFVGKNGLVEVVLRGRSLFSYSLEGEVDEGVARATAVKLARQFNFAEDGPDAVAVRRYLIVRRQDLLARYQAILFPQIDGTFTIFQWTTGDIIPFGEDGSPKGH